MAKAPNIGPMGRIIKVISKKIKPPETAGSFTPTEKRTKASGKTTKHMALARTTTLMGPST